ncbi:MAG: molybdopterin-dependent oxidoreductase, partial [Rhodospirillales bacterium]
EAVWPYQYAGTMGLVQRRSIQRLTRAFGFSRQEETICSTAGKTGWMAAVGRYFGVDPMEMAKSDRIVIWGGNPVATQIQTWRVATAARKARGTRIICVDPYRTKTAEGADWHIAPRPGTDGALAVAMAHVILRDGLADRDFLARLTDFDAEVESHYAERGPDWGEAITGIPAADIEAFAREFAASKSSFLRIGFGFSRGRNGSANMHAVVCLAALTGAWGETGGGALFSMSGLFKVDFSAIEAHELGQKKTRMLDMSRIGPVLLGERDALGDGPPVAAMLIQNTNPAAVAPETAKVLKGFAREDLFLCVHEQFLTETARFADVVLPATTFLEHDDLYLAGGHTTLQVALRVLEPLGNARENLFVVNELAKRLGADHPTFSKTARNLVDETLSLSGLPDAETILAQGGQDCARDWDDHHYAKGFGHADGRFHFRPNWPAWGQHRPAELPQLPDHAPVTEEADAEHPFRLVTAPAHNFLNTSFTETPGSVKLTERPRVFVTPGDAKRLGIGEGDRVRLGNRRADIALHASLRDGQQDGTLVVESIWPNAAFEEGLGINALVGADPVLPGGGAAFHDCAVWMRPESL